MERRNYSKQEKIFHGYQTYIRTNSKSLRFPNNALYQVGRYHSLKLKEPFNSSSMHITMRCEKLMLQCVGKS